MLNKAWRSLMARFGGKPQGRLRLSVHRDPLYPSSWQPIETSGAPPRTEIQLYLEASNLGADACWITTAEIDGAPVLQTAIGVRDAATHKFAPDNPLPPRRLTTLSLRFLIDGEPPATGEPFRATVILTDHAGSRHFVHVILH
jgi:hypothetical protein